MGDNRRKNYFWKPFKEKRKLVINLYMQIEQNNLSNLK